MSIFDEIIQKIDKYNRIAILYHVNADGDAIGSSLGLYHGILGSGKTVAIFGEEKLQDNLNFLPDSNVIQCDKFEFEQYDLVIVLDAGDLKRLGRRIEIYKNAKCTINIDHHISNNISSDINYVDTNASSTGEIIYDILEFSGKTISQDVATSIYTAIVTDTGNFKFSNTTSKTHSIASILLKIGIDIDNINLNLYSNEKYEMLKLIARIIDEMELVNNNKVAIMRTTMDQVENMGIQVEELTNVANYGLSVKGVELSIFFRESSENCTRISLRSKSTFDCSNFAKYFNGGGHVRASGCSIALPLLIAIENVLEKLKEIEI